MSESEKIEKRIFKISLWSGLIFVMLEVIMAVVSRSQTVLMLNQGYDAIELELIPVADKG